MYRISGVWVKKLLPIWAIDTPVKLGLVISGESKTAMDKWPQTWGVLPLKMLKKCALV